MSFSDEEARIQIALTIRKIMRAQDLEPLHLVELLKLPDALVKQKIAGKVDFTKTDLDKLCEYLHVELSDLLDPAYDEAKAARVKYRPEAPDKTVSKPPVNDKPPAKSSVAMLITHIAEGGDTSDLIQLKWKIFRSMLTGRIDNLGNYLANSLLVSTFKSLKKKRPAITELTDQEEAEFVEYYLKDYEQWKSELWGGADNEIPLLLINNKRSSIYNLLNESVSELPQQLLTQLLDECMREDNRIDILKLSNRIEKLYKALMQAKKPLDDYLYEQLNVSGS